MRFFSTGNTLPQTQENFSKPHWYSCNTCTFPLSYPKIHFSPMLDMMSDSKSFIVGHRYLPLEQSLTKLENVEPKSRLNVYACFRDFRYQQSS